MIEQVSAQMRIGVFGAGHVGLPTAAALAHIGHCVVVTDVDPSKLELLGRGVLPFYEPGLEALVSQEAAAGRLTFTSEPASVATDMDAVFICVGTPPRANGEANLLAVERAAESAARHATRPLVLVEKSTVPAGTASRIEQAIARLGIAVPLTVVSNPEFLREGHAVDDSLHPGRILVGSDSKQALLALRAMYAPLVRDGALWIETDVRTAELAKHACNAFLAMKISFANALVRICELSGGDVVAVTNTMGADPRIGPAYLAAGLGYGGYCFPKDLVAFRRLADSLGYDFPLLDEVARINQQAVDACFKRIEEALWNLESKRIALLGLAFKPGTDDVRFSPALVLARRLLDAGAHVVGFDPQAGAPAKEEVSELTIAESLIQALGGAHCAVVCTEWDEIRTMDLEEARRVMAFPILIDGRNVLEPRAVMDHGFTYIPTGRPAGLPIAPMPTGR
jgi:UDPglucose 6-dehydrogenase